MGRTVAILLGLVVIAGGGYFLWQSGALDEATEDASAAVDSTGDAVEDAEDAGESVLGAATDAVEDARSDQRRHRVSRSAPATRR